MNYVFGFILVSIESTFYSIANIYDEALSRDVFKSVWSILVMNGILLTVALPVLFTLLHPKMLAPQYFLIIAVVAFIEVFYQVPYYIAMRYSDASVVVSLFGLEKLLIPFAAYFIAHEHLSLIQYAGYGIIVVASIMISADKKHFRLSKAFYLMIPVVIMIAMQGGLEKLTLESVDWQSVYFWMLALSIPFYATFLLFSHHTRREVRKTLTRPLEKKLLPLYGQNIASWSAESMGVFATSLLPLTVVNAFGSFQSLIVHLISSKEGKWLHIKAEIFSWKRVRLCCLIAIGMILTSVG